LQRARNRGAFPSLGASLPEGWRNAIVVNAGGALAALPG
jgi:hypothetical protein